MNIIIVRIVFFVISSAVYPLLAYVILPFFESHESGGPDSVIIGVGAYAQFIVAFIISLILLPILAHVFVRAWWLGILALMVGCISVALVDEHKKYRDANRLYPYEKYYDNGAICESGNRIGGWSFDGQRHGKITAYYMDETIKSIETYKRGKLFGSCELYHPNGKLMAKGNFNGSEPDYGDEIGIPDGSWVYYHKSGRLDDERTYAAGKLLSSKNFKLRFDSTGLVRTIAEDALYTGSLVREGIIVDKYLFPNLYTTQVKNGRFDGDVCSYYTIGDELVVGTTATYHNGKRDGALKYYHTNGQLERDAMYVEGNLEGVYTTYYADSVATEPHGRVEYCCNYKNGERHGTARWYYDDGTLNKETEYLEGKRDGVSCEYRPDGRLMCLFTYKNDEEDGAFESYRDNGEYNKGYYKSGSVTLREAYRSDGTLYSIYQWQDGECIRSDRYDENGKLL